MWKFQLSPDLVEKQRKVEVFSLYLVRLPKKKLGKYKTSQKKKSGKYKTSQKKRKFYDFTNWPLVGNEGS